MSESDDNLDGEEYKPDQRLTGIFEDAVNINPSGLEALCSESLDLETMEGRYLHRKLLGRGGLKVVYRAYDAKVKRWVALAELASERSAEYYDVFVHEARLTASLCHPNIIKIHAVELSESGRPFFTMDLKGNVSLQDLGSGERRRDLRELLIIFNKICDAVAYAHSQKVVHLDLKPENIQCDAFGEVLVCDWGLAKRIDSVSALEAKDELDAVEDCLCEESVTLAGQIKGSLGYMAPEQVNGGQRKDERTDIYALGCLLHFILTGFAPYTGNREEIIRATRESEFELPSQRYGSESISPSLEAVLAKATAKLPAQRYGSVEALQREVRNYLSGYSTEAENSGFFREARLFLMRNRMPSLITAVALCILVTITVLFVQNLVEQRAQTAAEKVKVIQLSSDISELEEEYVALTDLIATARAETATRLSVFANGVKDLGIFERPLATMFRARSLLELAEDFDPGNEAVNDQYFSLYCLELNYKSALGLDCSYSKDPSNKYNRLARLYSDFDFDHQRRPTIEQLVSYFVSITREVPYFDPHLERVLSYDSSARRHRLGYEEVIEAFLRYVHVTQDQIALDYDVDAKRLHLWSGVDLDLKGQYGESILRFLNFKELVVESRFALKLQDLNGLGLAILDLHQCANVDWQLTQSMDLSGLEILRVRHGQISEAELEDLRARGLRFAVEYL